jgi:prepilin-type N-terminal cleavage/methylation domain-containing protein
MRSDNMHKSLKNKGFTLVEILIVTTIIGILAMIVVPKLISAQDDARDSAIETDLQMLRRQINLYQAQHGGRSPHVNELNQTDTANMMARMLGKTDESGKLNAAGNRGPYLTEWPENPYASSAVAATLTFGKLTTPPRDGTSGWYFCYRNLIMYPNTAEGALDLD